MFHSDLLLRRRISFSPPHPPQPSAAAVTAAGDFPGSSSPAENHIFRSAEGRSTLRWPPRRKPASHAPSRASLLRQLAVHAPARECACGRVAPSPVTGLHNQGRSAPSWCSSPPAVHSEHFFSTFWPFLPPPWSSVPLQSPTAVGSDLCIRAPPCREQYFCSEQYFYAVSNIFAASSLP